MPPICIVGLVVFIIGSLIGYAMSRTSGLSDEALESMQKNDPTK